MAFTFKKPDLTPVEVKTEVRTALAQSQADESILDRHQPPEPVYDDVPIHGAESTDDSITDVDRKLERLVADDFPFDESQVDAVDGLVRSQFGCLTGAAGTGKTTTTKKLVDDLIDSVQIGSVDMREYWSSDMDKRMDASTDSEEYELDEKNPIIPTILMCAFTGRATQQIKRNFPRSWHGNIMTIHRALGFVPEYYDDWDPEMKDVDTGESTGGYRKKMRFVPTYTAEIQMPWDIVIIDEAGMLGLDLWHQLLAATKPSARIYMVGDINQLPPVHGKSVFGFAMARWPAYELTKVHRQQGKDNPIVDNAWRIIHGQMPQSEGRFQMVKLKGDAQFSSRQVRATMPKLQTQGVYDPIRDTIITPINGEYGSRGFALGQMPLNAEFATIFNPKSVNPRYIIDGGRERKQFAVGDKVMATRNDYEAGITNGMTGIVTSIEDHEGYAGDRERFGPIDEVNARMVADDSDIIGDLDLEALGDSMLAIEKGKEQAKEKRDRGPASHIVTVRFGSEEHGFEIPFATLAEVGSLMTAYVVTCHKMQGGESPVVIVICHDAHRHMLYREWLYTAVTRASQMCILLYTETALKVALNKQTIKGRTLKEKVESFNALMDPSGKFDWSKEVRIPHCESSAMSIMDRADTQVVTPARLTTEAERKGGLAQLLNKHRVNINIREVHVHVEVTQSESPAPDTIDGGTIHAEQADAGRPVLESSQHAPELDRLPAGRQLADRSGGQLVSQWGAARVAQDLAAIGATKLLTHVPPPVKKTGLSFLMAKKLESM